jgi:hypothetical protein
MLSHSLYALPSPLINLPAAGATRADFPLVVENTYDFVWLDGIYSCDVVAVMAGTDVTFGGFLINVKLSAGQEKIFRDQVPIQHAFGLPGIGTGPRRMPFWAIFQAGAEVSLDVTNLGVTNAGGVNANLRITFFGVRLAKGMGATWPVPGISGVALAA